MLNDLKYAWRQIRKAPGFAITALLTLAIGIGVNAAVFSVMDAIVLRPLAVPDLNRVMTVAEDRGRGGFAYEWVAAANYEDWTAQSKSFESMAAFKRYSLALTGACGKFAFDGKFLERAEDRTVHGAGLSRR
jgi:hypothetical protein